MEQKYYLNSTFHKITKFIHHTFSICTLGGIICILALQLSKEGIIPSSYSSSIDFVIFFILDKIVAYAFLMVILSGIILSLFSHWGFLKNHWLIIKHILTVILLTHVIFWLIPSINSLAAYSESGILSSDNYRNLKNLTIFNSTISLILFFTVLLLSVIKPFGKRKIRKKYNRKRVIYAVASVSLILSFLLGFSSVRLYSLRQTEINKISFKEFRNGSYEGSHHNGNAEFTAKFEIENGQIKDIRLTTSYSNFYTKLAQLIKYNVQKHNRIDIDVISGATTTSKMFLKSIENAITKLEEK